MTRSNAEFQSGHEQGEPFLFHGTNADLNVGDVISPQKNGSLKKALDRDISNKFYDSVPEGYDVDAPHAWATSKIGNAKFYGEQRAHIGGGTSEGGTSRVYLVEPLNPKDVIKEPTGIPGEYASPSGFKVKDILK